MAFIQCDHFSESLGLSMTMNVLLPQPSSHEVGMASGAAITGKIPCLWLLHGSSDDHSAWMRRTSIERYVAGKNLAVVMPSVHKSYYCDDTSGANGYKFWQYISEELPHLARSFFPLSDAREDNYVAGLSMGGFGAFKLALNHPERYAAAASLSGALSHDWGKTAASQELLERKLGSLTSFAGGVNDLHTLAQRLDTAGVEKPRLFQCCGSEDFLIEPNRRFQQTMNALDYDYTYEESPGTHEWGYWDAQIQRVLAWIEQK